jgi:hypothetical protein
MPPSTSSFESLDCLRSTRGWCLPEEGAWAEAEEEVGWEVVSISEVETSWEKRDREVYE